MGRERRRDGDAGTPTKIEPGGFSSLEWVTPAVLVAETRCDQADGAPEARPQCLG